MTGVPFVTPAAGPVVETSHGPVRGVWRERAGHRSAAFLGIPYAAPPVGELRFAAPQPLTPWTRVRDAARYGPTPQVRPLSDDTFIPEPSIPGDDVLSVNVFTPDPGGRLPVLVWVHGGGNVAGSPASPWYDGRSFARDGVVVVTISYRLGVDGFGVLPGAPPNRAVLDWLAALRWVRDEVAAFGGDPARVTVAGQSAGGGAVTTLLVTPSARGLLHGAVPQSGVFGPGPLAAAERTTRRIARRLGVPPTVAAFARVPNDDLVAAASDDDGAPLGTARRVLSGRPGLGLGPVVDGELVPTTVADAVARGTVLDVPVLVGATRHEFTALGDADRAALAGLSPDEALAAVGADPDVAARLLAAHPGADAVFVVGQGVTDELFRRPVDRFATALHAAGRRVWRYESTWPVPRSGLAEHCSELPFVWDLLDADGVAASCGPTPPQALADELHGAWVRFVRDGDPGWAPAPHVHVVG